MFLSDGTLRELLESKELRVEPLDEDSQIQPASIDVRLSDSFCYPHEPQQQYQWQTWALAPHVLVLGSTIETVSLPHDIVARVEGKSTLGRQGLMVHLTAGFIDPGFEGQVTLEMVNVSTRPIVLTAGMRIAQLSFARLDRPALRPYGDDELASKYWGQMGATAAR